MNKITVGILSLLVAAAIVGSYFFPQSITKIEQMAGSPTNSTFGTQKVLGVIMDMSQGTSTSIQNNSASSVVATTLNYACTGVGTSQTAYTGVGLASVSIKIATTSVTSTGSTPTSNVAVGNTNLMVSTTLATTTSSTLVSSSTVAIGGTVLNAIIPSGAFVTVFTNATNTALCSINLDTISF